MKPNESFSSLSTKRFNDVALNLGFYECPRCNYKVITCDHRGIDYAHEFFCDADSSEGQELVA